METTPFGRYQLVELLGRGGMGEVWRAYDTETNNRTVAIKLLAPHLAADNTFVQRFRREADAAARLNNPHIIPIHTYGEIDGRLYVDMRLVEGRDLQEVLSDGPIEPGRAVRIIEQVATALHAAHKIGLVHRDVKPSNILIDEDDFAYLIDFGIARGAEETGLTNTGAIIGSWHYMAPERMGGREVDPRADIYALTCVLYECLTGSRPFPGDNLESQVAAHLAAPPPRASSTNPGFSSQVDDVIATGMAKQPGARFATSVDLAQAAREAVTSPIPRPEARFPPPPEQATHARQPAVTAAPPPSTKRPWWRGKAAAAIALTLVVAAVSVVAVVVFTDKQTAGPDPFISKPTQLGFTGLADPAGVAVDNSGSVYITDYKDKRVLKLPGGSGQQIQLPFTGLQTPEGVAVDRAGNVFVTDPQNNRVLKLSAGSGQQIELPFTGLYWPVGVAVDGADNLYVVDSGNNRALKLPGGTGPQIELPFVGLYSPSWLALTADGSLYVTDEKHSRVLKLAAGAQSQTELPFSGLHNPGGVAVGGTGNVYVTDGAGTYQVTSPFPSRVLMLPGGAPPQAEVPFTGLNRPLGLAVDSADNLYLTDNVNRRVLKLPAN